MDDSLQETGLLQVLESLHGDFEPFPYRTLPESRICIKAGGVEKRRNEGDCHQRKRYENASNV
jgi:hypothetical protein